MNLNEFAQEVHETTVKHGWWETEPSFGEFIALCHSELSEALEEYRNGKPIEYHYCNATVDYDIALVGRRCVAFDEDDGTVCTGNDCELYDNKPEGIAVELADCIIRILDYCGKEGIDIEKILRIKHEYNKTRPYKHGGKIM